MQRPETNTKLQEEEQQQQLQSRHPIQSEQNIIIAIAIEMRSGLKENAS